MPHYQIRRSIKNKVICSPNWPLNYFIYFI